jgi:type II secretory pathway pseudopilin PulG
MILPALRRRAAGTAGFTMVEIALCLGVIAIALVAIIGVMPTGLQVQKNNREDTIINQDGRFFMEAIRGGARGSDHLTNFVLSITYSNSLGDRIIHTNSPGGSLPSGYRNSITNGQAIVGLLSTPRFFVTSNGRVTNYISALVRSVSGTAEERSDLWRKATVNEPLPFAFIYLLTAEVAPLHTLPPVLTNFTASGLTPVEVAVYSNNWLRAKNLEFNFSELRLTLQGPVFMKGRTLDVAGRPKTFRTLIGGRQVLTEDKWSVVQPSTYVQVRP